MLLTRCISALLVCAAASHAEVRTETVEYRDGETRLKGFVAYDPEAMQRWEGGAPGVLVIPEWWGLDDFARDRARALAEMGFVAFAADMYGEGRTTDEPAEAQKLSSTVTSDVAAWRARAGAALDSLRKREGVRRDAVAAIGFCFGGSTALQMAYGGADLAAVVAFHSSLPAPAAEDKERIKARILVLHGTADPLAPMEKVTALTAALEGLGAEWRVSLYGGAQHSFTNPGADAHGIPGVKYDEAAARGAWREMMGFLRDAFGMRWPGDGMRRRGGRGAELQS